MLRLITLHKTSQIGLRETNEDVEGYMINLTEDGYAQDARFAPIDFFIICDGHGGHEVSRYICPRVQKLMTNNNLKYPLDHDQILKIYDQVQNEIIHHPQQIGNGCGSTCLVVVRYMNKNKECVQVVNLGDCRTVLSRRGIAQPLSKDHKPIWPDEKKRINEINKKYGTKQKIHFDCGDFRILDLSVSKSFGDLEAMPYLTHKPDNFYYTLKPFDEFIIIACDGLWDVLQSHEAVNFVRDHYVNNDVKFYQIQGYSPFDIKYQDNNIAKKLADYAIARGSTDNVSIMIVFLQ